MENSVVNREMLFSYFFFLARPKDLKKSCEKSTFMIQSRRDANKSEFICELDKKKTTRRISVMFNNINQGHK